MDPVNGMRCILTVGSPTCRVMGAYSTRLTGPGLKSRRQRMPAHRRPHPLTSSHSRHGRATAPTAADADVALGRDRLHRAAVVLDGICAPTAPRRLASTNQGGS